MESWKPMAVGGLLVLAGVGVGAQLFGANPARAQQGSYRECIFGRQDSLDVNDQGQIERPELNRTVLIPPGYEVVGGGGAAPAFGAILLCRR